MSQGLAEETEARESHTPRWLTFAVIGMGVAIVFGLVVLVGAIIYKATHHGAQPHPVPARTGFPANGAARLTLPLGPAEHVYGVTARSDGTLAVTLQSPAGARVVLWSPEAGTILGELDFGSGQSLQAPH